MGKIRLWLIRKLMPRKPVQWDEDETLQIDHGIHVDHDPESPHALYYVILRPKVAHELLGDAEPQALQLSDFLKGEQWKELAALFTSLADGTYVPRETLEE